MKKLIIAIILLFSLNASAQFYDENGNMLVIINDTCVLKIVNTDTLRFILTNTTDTLRFRLTNKTDTLRNLITNYPTTYNWTTAKYDSLFLLIKEVKAKQDSIIIRSTYPLSVTETSPVTSTSVSTMPFINIHLGTTDTIAGTWIDTLSRVFQGYIETPGTDLSDMFINGAAINLTYYWLSIVTDDTLEYCSDITFPQGAVTTVYPGSFTENSTYFIRITIPDFYIRRKGTIGTVTYSVALRGN